MVKTKLIIKLFAISLYYSGGNTTSQIYSFEPKYGSKQLWIYLYFYGNFMLMNIISRLELAQTIVSRISSSLVQQNVVQSNSIWQSSLRQSNSLMACMQFA